jgi:hypothetical protein
MIELLAQAPIVLGQITDQLLVFADLSQSLSAGTKILTMIGFVPAYIKIQGGLNKLDRGEDGWLSIAGGALYPMAGVGLNEAVKKVGAGSGGEIQSGIQNMGAGIYDATLPVVASISDTFAEAVNQVASYIC